MMQEGQYDHVGGIRRPSHTDKRGCDIVLVSAFLGNEQADDERPDIGDECTGGGVKTRSLCKVVETKAKNKTHKGQTHTGETKRQPKDVEIVQVGGDEPVQRRHLKQDENLYQD